MYYRRSIKGPTRKSRGTRFIFDGDAKLPSHFDDFLQNEDNKSFLNLFIATRAEAIDLSSDVGCVVYIIKVNTVIDCKDGEACHMYTDDNLTLEEADNRIICHIGHMIKADNLISIKVRSADTDVVAILLEFLPQFKLLNDHIRIWCDFGTGVNRKATLSIQFMKDWGRHYALPFHSFTFSVDVTLLHTYSITQRTSCMLFGCLVLYTKKWVFQLVSWLPISFCIDRCTPILEKFISYVYTKNPDNGKNLNEVRLLRYLSLRSRDFRFCYYHQMPSNYTPKRAATRLVGCGELNFTDQILLANRVGLAMLPSKLL